MLDSWPVGSQLLGERDKARIEEQCFILGMIYDIRELVSEQTRIDGVAYCTNTGDRVIGLEVSMIVPGKRGNPIAKADAEPEKGSGQLLSARISLRIGISVESTLSRARHNLGVAVITRRVVNQRLNQQRLIHHQTAHKYLRTWIRFFGLASSNVHDLSAIHRPCSAFSWTESQQTCGRL